MPMKLNSKKLITSAMLTLIGASMVGSVAGTVAWYQYSTRASAAYVGTSTKCSEKLQVVVGNETEAGTKADSDWKTALSVSDITNYIASKDGQSLTTAGQVTPVTAGNQKKDAALNTLKAHPVYNYTAYSAWQNAEATDYVTFPLTFRVVDVDGGSTTSTLDQDMDLYLQDLLIQADSNNNSTGKGDISDAIRVHFATTETTPKYWLFSNNGETIDTCGALDLDGDGQLDAASARGTNYSFETTSTLTYGDADSKEEAYKLSEVAPSSTTGVLTGGQAIGTITANTTLTINVTIWLEGWQKFGASNSESAMWDPVTYIGAMFDVGMTFAVTTI